MIKKNKLVIFIPYSHIKSYKVKNEYHFSVEDKITPT